MDIDDTNSNTICRHEGHDPTHGAFCTLCGTRVSCSGCIEDSNTPFCTICGTPRPKKELNVANEPERSNEQPSLFKKHATEYKSVEEFVNDFLKNSPVGVVYSAGFKGRLIGNVSNDKFLMKPLLAKLAAEETGIPDLFILALVSDDWTPEEDKISADTPIVARIATFEGTRVLGFTQQEIEAALPCLKNTKWLSDDAKKCDGAVYDLMFTYTIFGTYLKLASQLDELGLPCGPFAKA